VQLGAQFRFAPESGHELIALRCQLGAKSNRKRCSDTESFDDLVGNQTGADFNP